MNYFIPFIFILLLVFFFVHHNHVNMKVEKFAFVCFAPVVLSM